MEAMKAKDTVRLGALRNAKKYIIEAKTAGPEIAELPDADVLKIISKLAKQGADSAAIFTEQNRPDLAAEELAQVAVYQEFLPRQLTPEELEAAPLVSSDAQGGQQAAAPGASRAGALPQTGRRICGAIYVSCSGRGGPHFGGPSAELQIVRHALGDVPLVGFFAGGEIAHHHLYGYTGVLTVFVGA